MIQHIFTIHEKKRFITLCYGEKINHSFLSEWFIISECLKVKYINLPTPLSLYWLLQIMSEHLVSNKVISLAPTHCSFAETIILNRFS